MLSKKNISTFFQLMLGKLRRTWLTTFRPGYVRAEEAHRRGTCLQCGKCCRLAFRCPMLTRDNRCRIYHLARTASCRLFPLDSRDLREVQGECGYYFVDDAATPVR
jgi:hypothetical protein